MCVWSAERDQELILVSFRLPEKRIMLLKECAKCKRLIPYGKTYCDKCAPIMEAARAEREAKARKESNRRYNAKRDPKEGAFYRGKAWRRLSAARIQADGYKCVQCGKFATEVDHIVPIQTPAGWNRRYDWNNLQSLCKTCHNKKHHRFYKGGEGGGPGPSQSSK